MSEAPAGRHVQGEDAMGHDDQGENIDVDDGEVGNGDAELPERDEMNIDYVEKIDGKQNDTLCASQRVSHMGLAPVPAEGSRRRGSEKNMR